MRPRYGLCHPEPRIRTTTALMVVTTLPSLAVAAREERTPSWSSRAMPRWR